MPERLHVPWEGRPREEGLARFLEKVSGELQDGLLRHAHGIVRDWQAAEDVVQEAFAALEERLRGGNLSGDVAPWLWVLVRNKAVSHARGAARRAVVFSGSIERAEEVAAPSQGENELVSLAISHLGQLPEQQRRAVELTYLEGLTCEQAAANLGCEPSTVRKLRTQAIEKLRSLMKGKQIP